MNKELIVSETRFPYNAEDTPLGPCGWTRGSDIDLHLRDALPWANAQGASLQELSGAVLIRAGLYNAQKKGSQVGRDGSNSHQIVRTLAISYRTPQGGWQVAFAPLPDTDAGVTLATAVFEANMNCKQLILPLDGIVAEMLKVAREDARIVPALDNSALDLSVAPRKSGSAYENHPHVIAAFGGKNAGKEIAGIYAAYLRDRKIKNGHFSELADHDLEGILPSSDERAKKHAVIHQVSLGGDDEYIGRVFSAYDEFNDSGRARGSALL